MGSSKDKDYKKYIKTLSKDNSFEIAEPNKKNTVKITHIKSGELYSVHPGDAAILPLRSWINRIKKKYGSN